MTYLQRGRAFETGQAQAQHAESVAQKRGRADRFGLFGPSGLQLLLIAAALWSPMVLAACCHPTQVDRPVLITPPNCRSHDHPEPPVGAVFGNEVWSRWFVSFVAWALATEHECPRRERGVLVEPIADPGPAWWTTQPSGAVGD